MLPENPNFMVRGDDGQEYGPVDLAELRDWVQENRAGLGTEVRRDEPGAPWQAWQNYPELVALLAEVHVTSPVPGVPGLALATMWRRSLAFLLDLLLAYFICVPVVTALIFALAPDWAAQCEIWLMNPQNKPPEPTQAEVLLTLLPYYIILTSYFGGFVAAHGMTPAKQLLRLRVVDEAGRKPDFTRSICRAGVITLSVYLWFIPLAFAFFNPQRRALHDLIAGTYVVEA